MLWLYDEFETDFTYNGIVLNNAYDSDIHWVLNTMYKLTFKYPTVDNDLFSFIEKGMIVKADEHDRTNLFRIKDIDISENDKCITVTAYQKNYDFSKRLVNNFGRLRVNCMSVLDEWYSNFLSSEKDFSYYSDINAINSFVSHNDDTDNKLRTSFELLGGIADTYSADIDMHDKQISLLERLGRDTEEVLTTAKNISEFVNTSNSDEIVTRIYASSTFKVGDKYDKKDLREQHRQQLKALRESQKEYSQGRNAVKKAQQMKDEIAKRYAKELAKNNKKVKRSGKVIKSYSQIESEVNAKYQARERKSQQRKAESQAIADRKKAEIESLKAQQKEELEALDEEITINLIVESPLINDYPFINEIAVSNNDLRTAEELEEWAMEYFTKQNIDKPKNSIKVTYEQLSEDINRGDTVILKYLKYGVDERIRVVETHYDPMLKKWKEFILGEKEGRLGSEVSNASSGAIAKANAYTDIITMDIERKVKERSENYDKLFKKNTDEINKKIEDGFEKATASSEVIKANIAEDLEKKLAPIRNQVSTTVENYNRQFQATNLEISKNRVEATKQIQAANLEISKNRIEATKQIQALSERVNNMQDISSNSTVVELKKLVNEAKETGKSINQKVTELDGNVTREFTLVKAKNENDLKVIRGEIKTGVDGLTSKISSLEEYKNQDGSRTESLKQWVQRDTASQLSRERTEINKVIDSKGFVKNTEFSSKFTENARGITNQLTALENYKNQDGVRTANLQIWVQNNTANQLTAERRSIEGWVDGKGYATTSVVENKVQETANSISREIRNIRESIPTSVGGRNYITDSDKLTNINSGGTNWEKTVENGTLVFTKVRATESTGIWTQIMPFLKDNFQNEVLTWSLDVKASKNITFNNVGQETNGFKGRVDLTTEWQRISHTYTNRYTQHYAFVFYQMLGTCSPGDKVYVRLPKLEKGNVATDWTPAPEDNNAFVKNTEFSNKFNENAQGINRQLTALEQYKNQDSSRIETLKQWVQRDTANQLSRERTEINRIIDNKGYVKNTEFSNKFNESARGITNQLTALENYKNQDGVRVANMQIWAQNNTANQLTAERRSIESWVNEKGYATTSVVENKVQETANSFSREISNVRNSIPTSIGGRNYISNSNFAKDMENWELPRLNNSGLNWQKGHAIYHFGRGLHIWGTPNGEYKGLGTIPFSLTAKQGEKITVSMDLGKDALTAHSILFIGLHYIVDNDIVSQQWQTLDLATQNFEVKKYKRISKTFTVTADMNRCRLMIHTKPNQLINFYVDNIKLEKGDISTDWTPAPEDVEQNVNELNTWKQTTNQTLNTVTSTLNDTVRHAQLRIGADGIDFGSNKVFNGRNLASILSVSPESIQAITDRLVISPANENLVKREYRDTFILNVRNGVLNRIYGSNVDLVGEYQFKVAIIDFDTPILNASIHVKYKDGTDSWFN
nr:MAG TPA: tail protein [Bacteriophage sp.]